MGQCNVQSPSLGTRIFPVGANGISPMTNVDVSVRAGADLGSSIPSTVTSLIGREGEEGTGKGKGTVRNGCSVISMDGVTHVRTGRDDIGVSLLHSFDTIVDSCERYLRSRSVAICVAEEDIQKLEAAVKQEELVRVAEERKSIEIAEALLLAHTSSLPSHGNGHGNGNGSISAFTHCRNGNSHDGGDGGIVPLDQTHNSSNSMIRNHSNEATTFNAITPSLVAVSSYSSSNSSSSGSSCITNKRIKEDNVSTLDPNPVPRALKRARQSDTTVTALEAVIKRPHPSACSSTIPDTTSLPPMSTFMSVCVSVPSVIEIDTIAPVGAVFGGNADNRSTSNSGSGMNCTDKSTYKEVQNSQSSSSSAESVDLGSVDSLSAERVDSIEVEEEIMEVEVNIDSESGVIIEETKNRTGADQKTTEIEKKKVKVKGYCAAEKKDVEIEKDREKERDKRREKEKNKYVSAVMLRLWRAECRRIFPTNEKSSNFDVVCDMTGTQVSGYSVLSRSLEGWELYVQDGAETVHR